MMLLRTNKNFYVNGLALSILPTALLSVFSSQAACAKDLQLTIQLPQLTVAEYHKPYVATWIEQTNQTWVANLNVWYDIKKKNNEGTKWLKELRQWWRKSGRDLSLPIDGLSGATRNAGEHRLTFADKKNPLSALPSATYVIVVEVTREAGGRELIRVPIQWQGEATTNQRYQAKGTSEVGEVSVQFK